jgi:major membrane immunogen (membrane-anchored lipoprotein)
MAAMKTKIGLVVVASALLLTGCSTNHIAKWDYRRVGDVSTDYINKMADEGWVVAGFSVSSDGGNRNVDYLLKRPKK